MKTNRLVLGMLAIVVGVLAGCGGGGSDPPVVDTGSAVITSAGGTVATTSGAAKAVFPANAVNASTTVTITASSQAPVSSRLISGTAYEFSPSGALAQPVAVTLRYDPARLPAGALQSKLVLYKAVNGAWVAVPNSVVDSVAYTVTAPLSSFSIYAVLVNNQFEGNYAGTYSGTNSGGSLAGTWNAAISADGSLTATATGGFAGTGGVGFSGDTNISLAGSGTAQNSIVTFAGAFNLNSVNGAVAGNGSWTSNDGAAGTWVGNRVP